MTPSPQQLAIFQWAEDPHGGNAIVHAGAGSGKTTTSVATCFRIPQRLPGALLPQSIIFLAFNKNIAEELKRRLPSYVSASTFHAHGMRALRSIAPKNTKDWVQGNKVSKLVFAQVDRSDPDLRNIIRLVSLMKTTYPATDAKKLISHHDLDFVDERKAAQVSQFCFEKSIAEIDHIDFDDMLFLPVHLGLLFAIQDWIFVDEAQDTNGIQLKILTLMTSSTTRICAVGDPHQAIYGFRGANHDSMDFIEERFCCKKFDLNYSFRCPKAVVREAQKVLGQIQFLSGQDSLGKYLDREHDVLEDEPQPADSGYYGEQEL